MFNIFTGFCVQFCLIEYENLNVENILYVCILLRVSVKVLIFAFLT